MSRKHIVILITLLLAVVVYFLWSNSDKTERTLEDNLVENSTYSLSFNYPGGADGYELIESNTSDDFLQSYVLVEKTALAEYRASEAETAPPTISIFIFQIPDSEDEENEEEAERPGRITRLQNWAQANAGLTSFADIYGTPDIVEVDGVKALEYSTDGVYQQAIYLVSYRGFIYMFVGQYDRPTDFIKGDFENMMQNVRFE